MKKRGRKPIPNAIKKARGNPGKRRILDVIDYRDGDIAEPPEWMSCESRDAWVRIVRELEAVPGLIKPVDHIILSMAVVFLTEWERLSKKVQSGELRPVIETKDKDGNVVNAKPDPEYKIWLDLSKIVMSIGQEFGVTPSSRASLHIKPDTKSQVIDILAGKKGSQTKAC